MEDARINEENLREAAAVGDLDKVKALIHQSVDVNSRNSMNGWTALHWACKRGHQTVVECLLQNGADSDIQNEKGETCLQLTENPQIKILIGGETSAAGSHLTTTLPIVPNYMSNPPFPHASAANDHFQLNEVGPASSSSTADMIILKVRVASCRPEHKDFIEIEISRQTTFDQLVRLMWIELGLCSNVEITMVRKLPDTLIRNDRDVRRLHNYQELELVLNHDYSYRILRIRIANSDEKDFIEILMLSVSMDSFDDLVEEMRSRLGVDTNAVVRKVRKLPNTIIRTSGDVQRLRNNDELELVLAQDPVKFAVSTSGDTGYKAAVSPKQIDIVY